MLYFTGTDVIVRFMRSIHPATALDTKKIILIKKSISPGELLTEIFKYNLLSHFLLLNYYLYDSAEFNEYRNYYNSAKELLYLNRNFDSGRMKHPSKEIISTEG